MSEEQVHTVDPVGQVLASNLKRLRQRRRWTLKETAEEIAAVMGTDPLSEAGLSRWESATPPRRFSLTELFAICRVFDVPLALLLLPDLDAAIPTIQGEPFFAVWNACFDSTEKTRTRWQQMDFIQNRQTADQSDGDTTAAQDLLQEFTIDELAAAAAQLRESRGER